MCRSIFDQHYSSYTVCSSLASVKLWPQFNIFYRTSSFWQKGSKAFPNFVIILKLENSSEFTCLGATKEHNHKLVIVCCPVFLFFSANLRPFFCDILTSIEAKPILKSMRPLTWSKKGPPFPRRPSHFLRRTDVCSLTFPILWRRTKMERKGCEKCGDGFCVYYSIRKTIVIEKIYVNLSGEGNH